MLKIIKPGDGTMIDSKVTEALFQTTEYKNIEKKVKPEMFYDFLSLKRGDSFENDESTILVSIMHYTLMQRIRTNIMKVKKADMVRGLVGLGTIAHANQRNLMGDAVGALTKMSRVERKQELDKRFQKSLNRLNFDDSKTKTAIKYVARRYGNNKYGKELWAKCASGFAIPEINFESSGVNIFDGLKDLCRKMTKKSLTDEMFILKDKAKGDVDTKNMPLCLTISNRFLVIQEEITRMYMPDKMRGQVLRGFFVTGLHILSKWVVEDKVSELEYNCAKLIAAMDKAASAY